MWGQLSQSIQWGFTITENKSVHRVIEKIHTNYPIILFEIWTESMDHQEHDENKKKEREIPAAEKLRKQVTKETENRIH